MALESYVEDILKSPESIFRKILSKIIQQSDRDAKIELVRQHTEVDKILFLAINSILDDLKREEGIVSRLLYRYFNMELIKNKKREQLIILGIQLKTQYCKIIKEKKRVDIHILNLSLSLTNLKLLKDALVQNRESLLINQKINKSNAFIKKLELKIDKLDKYKNSLKQKYTKLNEIEKLYANLYKKIPRYHELQEENFVNLIAIPIKQKGFLWSF
jgi:hypothetical protein